MTDRPLIAHAMARSGKKPDELLLGRGAFSLTASTAIEPGVINAEHYKSTMADH